MGQMRFIVSPPQRITEEVLRFAYMSGMDRTPWVVQVEADDGELVLERDVSDSGTVTVPWHVEGHGLLALSTATLIERWEPYHLPLELARGTINLLRTQLYEWQSIGLTVPDEVHRLLKDALLKFSWAVVQPDSDDGAAAQEALRIALDGSQLLAAAYCRASDRRPPPGDGPAADAAGRHAQRPGNGRRHRPLLPGRLQHGDGACFLARRGGHGRQLRLVGLRSADPVVPRAGFANLPGTALAARRPRPARLGLSLGRRFRQPAVGGRPIRRCRREALSRKGRSLALCGPRRTPRKSFVFPRKKNCGWWPGSFAGSSNSIPNTRR